MLSITDRLASAVKVNPDTGCWEWQRALDRDGYGRIKVGGRGVSPQAAHRVSYEAHVGPIPAGLQIDHLCRVRNCVNPDHLEAVTSGENTRRSPWNSPDHCRRGHPRTPENTYIQPSGHRACRVCHTKAVRKHRAAQPTP